jgi:hypothetical protein
MLLTIAWLMPLDLLAQTHPVFLRIKGVGTGSNVTGSGTDMELAGNFAYVAHPGGLEIYCVTNPAAPVRVGGYETRSPANAVALAGRYAYLALGATQTSTNDPGAFEIVDVDNPANPLRVGQINPLARANDIRVAGNYAYVAECTRWTGSNLVGALEIFDIRTPTNPLRVATFDTLGCATSIDVSGNYAYLTDSVTDVQVLNVSDPSNPWRTGIFQPDLSRCAFEPIGPANYVRLVDNLAYSAGGHGLNVLDISDPSQPVPIADNSCIAIYSLNVADHYAYMAIWHSFLNAFYLHIVDTTNPTNLVAVGLKADWQPTRMQVVGNLMYLAANPLLVYELTDRPMINSISNKDGNITLVWDYAPGFVLQRTASLVDPFWTVVLGSADQSFIDLPATGENEFFRLARP